MKAYIISIARIWRFGILTMSNCATDLGATITKGLNRSATKIDVFPVNYIFNIQLIIVAIQYFFAELDILY
jgi:hypothetical protein